MKRREEEKEIVKASPPSIFFLVLSSLILGLSTFGSFPARSGEPIFRDPVRSTSYPTQVHFYPPTYNDETGSVLYPFRWIDGQGECKYPWNIGLHSLSSLNVMRSVNLATARLLQASNPNNGKSKVVREREMSNIIASAPSLITHKIGGLSGGVCTILSENVVVEALFKMVKQSKKGNVSDFAKNGAHLVQTYIKCWAQTNPRSLSLTLSSLLNSVIVRRSLIEPYQLGSLLGVMLSGANRHSLDITDSDETKSKLVSYGANMAWGGTSLFAIIPGLGTIASALLFTSSAMGIVTGASLWEYLNPVRDFRNKIIMQKGRILDQLSAQGASGNNAIHDINLHTSIVLNYNGQNG